MAKVLGHPRLILDNNIQLTPRTYKVKDSPGIIVDSNTRGLANPDNRKPGSEKLTREDYELKYFDADVLQTLDRIYVKRKNQPFEGGLEAFIKLWSEKAKPFSKDINFRSQSKKLIVDILTNNYAIVFSPGLAYSSGHEKPLFGTGCYWGWGKANLISKENDSQEWYIDIYTTNMKYDAEPINYSLDFVFFPWKFNSMKKFLKTVNGRVKRTLKRRLKNSYNEYLYKFELSLDSKHYSQLNMGKRLQARFSPNLHHLLGYGNTPLTGKSQGMRPLSNKIDRDKKLFILSNIARPTAYGDQHLQILQSFIHKNETAIMTEKRFDPIVYLPLMTNFIDMVEIQLADEDYKPVNINDTKSLVCLYFRKVREKAML